MKAIVWLAIITEVILIGLAWGGGMLFQIIPWHFVQWTPQAFVWGVLAALPLFAGMIWSTKTQWGIFIQLREMIQTRVVPMFSDLSISEMLVISIFAGVGEELFFRGLLQTGLTNASSLWVGLGITSMIFGLVHFVSWTYAVLAGLIGVYLGVLFVVTGNLAVPMITHALYDFVALVVLVNPGNLYPNE